MEDSARKTSECFRLDLQLRGWSLFHNVLSPECVAAMRQDSLAWIERCNALQVQSGINSHGDNTGHHTLGAHDSLDRFIDQNPLHRWVDDYFVGRPYILHAFNPVGGAPQARTYVHRIHRDAKTPTPGLRLKLNMLVLLDDFTQDNGATQLLEGSHHLEHEPPEAYFDTHHRCVIASAGSIVLFDSNLWHRGGFNTTNRHRVALTLAFSLPFIKPQLDYARMLGPEYLQDISALTRQILGYNAQTPQSLNEWYRKPENRLYKSSQG